MTNEQVVRDACRVVWTEGDMSRVAEFYSEDFHASYPRTDWGKGVQGVTALAKSIRASFPDYREQIDELIVADDLVIVRLTIRGTHNGPLPGLAATGKTVEFNDVTICRVRDGKIVEQRGLSDHFALYQQLGLINLSS
ncbi:MAG: ester cyclase [Pseudomonadales bacterium]